MNASLLQQVTALASAGDPIHLKILEAAAKGRSQCTIYFKSITSEFKKEWARKGCILEIKEGAPDCDCDYGCNGSCPERTKVTFNWERNYQKNYEL